MTAAVFPSDRYPSGIVAQAERVDGRGAPRLGPSTRNAPRAW